MTEDEYARKFATSAAMRRDRQSAPASLSTEANPPRTPRPEPGTSGKAAALRSAKGPGEPGPSNQRSSKATLKSVEKNTSKPGPTTEGRPHAMEAPREQPPARSREEYTPQNSSRRPINQPGQRRKYTAEEDIDYLRRKVRKLEYDAQRAKEAKNRERRAQDNENRSFRTASSNDTHAPSHQVQHQSGQGFDVPPPSQLIPSHVTYCTQYCVQQPRYTHPYPYIQQPLSFPPQYPPQYPLQQYPPHQYPPQFPAAYNPPGTFPANHQ